jgi:hypothetical protein
MANRRGERGGGRGRETGGGNDDILVDIALADSRRSAQTGFFLLLLLSHSLSLYASKYGKRKRVRNV